MKRQGEVPSMTFIRTICLKQHDTESHVDDLKHSLYFSSSFSASSNLLIKFFVAARFVRPSTHQSEDFASAAKVHR